MLSKLNQTTQFPVKICRGEELRLPMNPSGTLVLSPRGSEQGEERRRGPTGLQMPRNPTGLKMPEEENTLPSRFDRNIEKVYPVLGHRFVAKVGIHIPWW